LPYVTQTIELSEQQAFTMNVI